MSAGHSNLTVLVVCHDSGPYLNQTSTSIRSQGSFSVALVDDGSMNCTCDAVIGGVIGVQEENDLEVRRQHFPASRMLGAMTARIDVVRYIGRAMNAGFTDMDDPEPALMRRVHENNSGFVHRDQARRDLMHHLRTNVVRRREA